MIKPVITEKTTELAKEGKYTFRLDANLSKDDIKSLISRLFSVTVTKVKTIKSQGEIKNTLSRRKKIVKPSKKAIVTLKGKETIDLFESKKSKKK